MSEKTRLMVFFTWLVRSVHRPGWRRWLVFAVAALVFAGLFTILRSGVDYRRDPSALVPRDVGAFFETRDFSSLLRSAAEWPVWNDGRSADSDQWNHLQILLAGLIGDRVHGLGSRLPLSWFAGARRSAIAWMHGENDLPETWAVYMEIPFPVDAVEELTREPGIVVTPHGDGPNFFVVSGNDRRSLVVRALGSWLIVASDPELPLFAEKAVRNPSRSLAVGGPLPEWRRETVLRGVFNPSEAIRRLVGGGPFAGMAGRMRGDSRCVFSASADSRGGIETRTTHAVAVPVAGTNVIWSTLKLGLWIVAVLCLLVAAAVLLVMLGWSGWLKALAVRAGISPASGPAEIEPSAAFREDAGVHAGDPVPLGDGKSDESGRDDFKADEPNAIDAEEDAPSVFRKEADAPGEEEDRLLTPYDASRRN